MKTIDIIEVGAGNSYFIQQVGNDEKTAEVRVELIKAPADQTKNFKPSKIRKLVNQRVHILDDVARRFPTESAAFFVAIGALNYFDLMINYSKNPTVQAQHVDTLLDPVGHLGFAAFMYVNGEVGHILGSSIKNENFRRHFLPYVGMSAGMMASNIVHEVMHDKDLLTCWKILKVKDSKSKEETRQKQDAACDLAYENWVTRFHEKAYAWAPSLASMMASTFVSGVLNKGWHQLTGVAGKFLKAHGFDLIISIGPQGPLITFAKQVANFAVFTYADWLLNPLIRVPFNNFVGDKDFQQISKKLYTGIYQSKLAGWSPTEQYIKDSCLKIIANEDRRDCRYQLVEDLKEFSRLKKKWRQTNLEQIYTAHNSWIEMVNRATGQAAFAEKTYNDFLHYTTMTNSTDRHGQQIPNPVFNALPLWGVLPEKRLQGQDREALLLSTKSFIYTDSQLAHLRNAVENFHFNPKELSKNDENLILQILKQLSSHDINEISRGLVLLNDTLQIGRTHRNVKVLGRTEDLLLQLRNELGNPWPSLKYGEAFTNLNDFLQKSSQNESLKNWRLHTGLIPAQTPTQKIIANMICGPGEATIEERLGFGVHFVPPRLIDYAVNTPLCDGYGNKPSTPFFNFQIDTAKSPFEFLYKNLDRRFYSQKIKNNWWGFTGDAALLDWFEKKKPIYEELVVKLLEAFHIEKDHAFNKSGYVPNNIADSLEQEFKVHALILGELLRDNEALRRDPKFYEQLFSENHPPLNTFVNLQPETGGNGRSARIHYTVPFLKVIRLNKNLNLFDLLSMYKQRPEVGVSQSLEKVTSDGKMLKIHLELMHAFQDIQYLFKQIKISQIGSKKIIIGKVRNLDFEKKLDVLRAKLKNISDKYFKFMDNLFTKKLFAESIKGLESVASEYTSYGEIINLMNAEQNHEDAKEKESDANAQLAAAQKGKKICVSNSGTNKTTQRSDDGCKDD